MENTSFEIAKVKESEREAIEKAERTGADQKRQLPGGFNLSNT